MKVLPRPEVQNGLCPSVGGGSAKPPPPLSLGFGGKGGGSRIQRAPALNLHPPPPRAGEAVAAVCDASGWCRRDVEVTLKWHSLGPNGGQGGGGPSLRMSKGEYLPCWPSEGALIGGASSGVPAPRRAPASEKTPPTAPSQPLGSACLTPRTAGVGWGGGKRSGPPSVIALVTRAGGRG